jgi:hypothetical protein
MTLSTAPFESRMRISPRRKQTWPFAISNIVDHAKFYSRSHDAVIRVFNERQQWRSATAHARRESFFSELPHAIPIGAGGISAQDLNALKEDVGRAVIRT